jgi:integrase
MLDVARQYRDLHERSVREFMRFAKNISYTYADEITPQIAMSYLEQNFGGGNGKTYNNQKSLLNTIFRCCLIQAGIAKSPFESIINKRVRNVEHHRPLTVEEFLKAFAVAREPWKTASLISWHTAMRKETCFRLAWEHISIDNGVPAITIMPGKTARFGRAVYIPIHEELWAWLKSLPRPADDKTPILSQFPPIHSWSDGRKTYYAGLLQSLGIMDNKQGKASFHSLRGSFVMRCDENDVNRQVTRGVVGQVEDHTTDLYSQDRVSARKILDLPAAGIFNK